MNTFLIFLFQRINFQLVTLTTKCSRRKMYFTSCFMTITSLVGVASCNYLLFNFDLESNLATALKWMTLISAGALVFSVQLGVQTLPTLLSGKLLNDVSSIGCTIKFRREAMVQWLREKTCNREVVGSNLGARYQV